MPTAKRIEDILHSKHEGTHCRERNKITQCPTEIPKSIKFRGNERRKWHFDDVRCCHTNACITHRVIDTPHENTEERFVRTEQLNLLMFDSKVFLFELAKPAGHLRHAGHVFRVNACDEHLSNNTTVLHVCTKNHRISLYTTVIARSPRST